MNRLRLFVPCLCAALFLLAGRGRAETTVWSDNFDTNAASRWTVNTVWRIGSPTAGPKTNSLGFRTFSGKSCASTQGYKVNTDARLACTNYDGSTTLTIPTADQHPRLRFWHWFNIIDGLGYVEISLDGGNTWTQISQSYQSATVSGSTVIALTSGGVWSRPDIDLTDFAGLDVQFAFHFYGASYDANSLGWFVDDVEVVTSDDPPTLNFPEGFEFDPKTTDWAVDGGTWEIGKPTSGPKATHSGTNCAATVLAGNYPNYADTRLISPTFTVPENGATLKFWNWYTFGNAVGFVEINDDSIVTTTNTITTITTNLEPDGINTNIYQLSGAANTSYSTPLYWNQTFGGWTNATKIMGSVLDPSVGYYRFEAGNRSTFTLGGVYNDYVNADFLPEPQSTTPTNFLDLDGAVWSSTTGLSDFPVGDFATNYIVTYTTNTTTVTTETTWNQISATFAGNTSSKWVQEAVDLSAYAGETVQLAFHFGSASGTVAVGWYVDDLSIDAAPTLMVPTNQVINFGQQFTNILTATNTIEPNSIFTFALAEASTNAIVKTNGLVIWTNTVAPPGTYNISAQVTDNSSPPLSDTNSFSVTVLPLSSQLILTNVAFVTNGGHSFRFNIKTHWTNNPWLIVATTNLASSTNWFPIYTNQATPGGTLQFTDLLATNFIQRYYRAMFQSSTVQTMPPAP